MLGEHAQIDAAFLGPGAHVEAGGVLIGERDAGERRSAEIEADSDGGHGRGAYTPRPTLSHPSGRQLERRKTARSSSRPMLYPTRQRTTSPTVSTSSTWRSSTSLMRCRSCRTYQPVRPQYAVTNSAATASACRRYLRTVSLGSAIVHRRQPRTTSTVSGIAVSLRAPSGRPTHGTARRMPPSA